MVEGVREEMSGTKGRTVFISYASQDAAVANTVVGTLEGAGLACWIAPRDVEPGALYAGEIVRAINESTLVVLVLSAHAVGSPHVGKELERASSKRRRIITLRTDAAVLPHAFEYFLSESQWVEVGAGGIEPAAAKLAEAARRHLGSGQESCVDESRTVALPRNSTITTDSATEGMASIAVLPFANLSGDKEQEYFSDGLAEEIINALVQISGLRVIARTSAFAFRGQNIDIRRIAETLGVAHVLEGSVRRSGNRIRVTAQLISASNGSHLWSERYDRELADVFAVQDEISAAIAEALEVRLSRQTPAAPRHTPELSAYEALLKARHFNSKITLASMAQAMASHQQAIALDPQYALANAEYAQYLLGRAAMGFSPLREVAPAIRTLAQRALELDPSLSDAHGLLCSLAATHDYDWHEAGRQFALATPGGRGSTQVHFQCGHLYFLNSGRREEAVKHLQLAFHADPLNFTYRAILAGSLGAVGRYDEADELLYQGRDLDQNHIFAHLPLALSKAARQQFDEALPFAVKAFSLTPWYPPVVGIYAGLLVRTGEPDRGREIVKALGAAEAYGASRGLAVFHTVCGEIDAAAKWWERALEERDPSALYYLQTGLGEPLRASGHWARLAALANLPVVNTGHKER